MEVNKISIDKIKYVNFGYILSQLGHTSIIEKNATELKIKLEDYVPNSNIELLVFDMDNVIPKYNEVKGKSSYLKLVFEDIVKKESVENILFANCSEETANFLREKDFPDSNNIFVLSFEYETDFLRSSKNASSDEALKKIRNEIFNTDTATANKDTYLSFISGIISKRIKRILSENNCIENLNDSKKHILSSTPVHVNKYVNLKPVLENHVFFQEICYLLYRQIINKCSTPDYIVASSRNSMYIASGLLKYFQTADLIVIDQISPVTKLSNFSNLDDIKPRRTYAMIEDFCCMGTEIKTVKTILWSRGVNVEQDFYVFPIVSTNLYGKNTNNQFKAQKIYPLYILEKSENYLMFTDNCCPYCNEIICEHSKKFNLKKRTLYETI